MKLPVISGSMEINYTAFLPVAIVFENKLDSLCSCLNICRDMCPCVNE